MRPSKTIENVRVAMQNRFIEVRFKSLRWKVIRPSWKAVGKMTRAFFFEAELIIYYASIRCSSVKTLAGNSRRRIYYVFIGC